VISSKKKFIFVHVPKTAGSSIEYALSDYSDDKVTKIPGDNVDIRDKHIYLLTICKRIGYRKCNEFFKFTFVRNPFDRIFSYFRFYKKINTRDFIKFGRKLSDNTIYLSAESKILDFNDWIIKNYNNISQIDIWPYIVDEKGDVIIDFIGKYENINMDFKKICEILEINDVALPHINKSGSKADYRKFYNSRGRKYIEKKCEKELEYFNYTY
jgi:hypothetical protein